jgi:FlaA1/EpsC-like NDP-sugar epimerase
VCVCVLLLLLLLFWENESKKCGVCSFSVWCDGKGRLAQNVKLDSVNMAVVIDKNLPVEAGLGARLKNKVVLVTGGAGAIGK